MPQDKATVLATYRELLNKVETKFGEIQSRNSQHMKCGRGCHSCCLPELTVFEVERANIKNLLDNNPKLKLEIETLELQNPHQGSRCRFLRANGECSIYEARPLVCRSHGAPLYFKLGTVAQTDVCPLNFTELAQLSELSGQDFINLDLLNTILAALNQELDASGSRHQLRLSEILKD